MEPATDFAKELEQKETHLDSQSNCYAYRHTSRSTYSSVILVRLMSIPVDAM